MSPRMNKVTGAVLALAAGLTAFAPTSALAQSASPANTAAASPTPAATAVAPKASVRVVHASPDAPAVDIFVNDRETMSNLAYRRVTNYSAMDAGTYTIKVYPTSANGQGTPALQTQVTLNPGWDYTIAAVGRLAQIQAKVIPDNLNAPERGKVKVRAYHFSANAPAVNVAVKNGSTLVRGLTFPNATDYLTVDAGRVNLSVQNAADNTEVLAINNANLAANAVQSVFVFGLAGEQPALSSLVTTDRKPAATRPASSTPATGPEDSMLFMLMAVALTAATGFGLKKLAAIEEMNNR